jgi:hypothetical protein
MRGLPRVVCGVVSLVGLALGACDGEVEGGGEDDPGDEQGGDPDAAPGGPDAAVVDAVPGADARTDRFRCLGEPLPTTAADPIRVGGTISRAGLQTRPLSGATVEVFRRSGGSAMASATSGGDGSYSVSIVSDGDPLDTYMRMSSGTLLKTELYAGSPVVADVSGSDSVLTDANTFRVVTNLVGVTQAANLGAVTVRVGDCDNNPVSGATLTGFGNARVFYAGDDGRPSSDPTATGALGLAFVFNVPTGDLTINAEIDGETLRPNRIASRAGTLSLAQVSP